MSRKQSDKTELTRKFNILRQENLGKKFTSLEMFDMCHKYAGISKKIFDKMAQDGVFDKYSIGRNVFYMFRDTPLHKDRMFRIFTNFNKKLREKRNSVVGTEPKFSEQEAISFLKGKGYKVLKPQGLDLEALKNDCPEIFEKYSLTVEV